jgi:hypothetical protein
MIERLYLKVADQCALNHVVPQNGKDDGDALKPTTDNLTTIFPAVHEL